MIVLKILKWIILAPILIIALWGVGRLLFCGPDKSVLKVTDPMAMAIMEYVNTHGRPKNITDIPSLPYKMQDCKIVEEKNIKKETCYFLYKGHKYVAHIITQSIKEKDFDKLISIHVDIYCKDKNTNVYYSFTPTDTNRKKIYLFEKHISPIKRNGICKNGILKIA